jgi:microcystin synthetase protein McyJ
MQENSFTAQLTELYKSVEESASGRPVTLWLNLGLWHGSDEVEEACKSLFDQTVDTLQIQGGAKILDAGFGYGVQDIHLAEQYPNCHISGVNVIESQLMIAQALVKEHQLENRISLFKEDASRTTFKDGQFDFVIAIESAFHFNTRELFFKEAYRLLKAGGKIALADCLPPPEFKADEAFKSAASRMAIPLANLYSIHNYIDKMREAGFKNVVKQDITDGVLPKAAQEMFDSKGWRASDLVSEKNTNEESRQALLKKFTEVTTIGKYYIVTAEK